MQTDSQTKDGPATLRCGDGFGPYYWTRRWRGQATERPRVNHKPNAFAKLATVRKHVSDFVRSYQTYGDRGEVVVTIRDHVGRIVEKQSVWPNIAGEP